MTKKINGLLMMCLLAAAFFTSSCSKDVLDDEENFQGFTINSNSDVNKEFLTNWENIHTVVVNTSNNIETTATPWSSEASISVLPDEICNDVKKKDGWEMVFCSLGNPNVKDANYFALYNRYLGIMRVFCFVADASGNGSEASFGVKLGSTNHKAPFYHTLAYGIPSSHKDVNTKIDIASTTADSFYAYYSPYTITGQHVLTRGWCAFDVDMSAYNNNPDDFFNNDSEHVTLYCSTVSKSDVKLSGTLDASIKGEYTSAKLPQNASSGSGIGSTLSMLGELLGNVQMSALANIERAITGSPWDAYSRYAGMAFKGTAWIAQFTEGNPYHVQDLEEIPGKLDMNLNGTIDLSGYITSLVPNNIPALKLSAPIMKQAGSHFAHGVWSLEEDPVVYISGNKFMGKGKRINFVVGENGQYNSSALDYDELRLMTFFDPTSVKVNLNTELFPDIDSVKVEAYYGVLPEQPLGTTAKYQALLNMDERKPICIVNHDKYKKGNIYRSADKHTDAMDYISVDKESLIDSDATEEEKKLYTTVEQAGGNFKYYGQVVKGMTGTGKKYVLEPQIYFPLLNGNSTVCDGIIPDLVVTVNVTVKAGGSLYTYTRNFVPKVKVVTDNNELQTVRTRLNNYVDAAKSGKSSEYVNNIPSVPVTFCNAEKRFSKIIDFIDLILK